MILALQTASTTPTTPSPAQASCVTPAGLAGRVIRVMRQHYIEAGFLYSGCCTPLYLARSTTRQSEPVDTVDIFRTMPELAELGLVRRRAHCDAWELSPAERVRLIDKHQLDAVWERTARFFYPNHPESGEVSKARREAGLQPCA
jgi:hypothetical protein